VSLTSDLGDRFKAEFIGKAIAVLSGGILTIVLVRLLDPDSYGLLFLAISVLGTVKLLSQFGIAKSAARYVAEYKETNVGQLPHILKFSFILNIGAITVVSTIFLIGHKFIATLIGEPDLVPMLRIGVLFVIFSTLMWFVRTILQGLEAIKPAATVHALDRGSRLVFAVGFVLLGYEAIGALVGYILASTIAALFGLVYLYFQYYREMSPTGIEQGIRRRIVEYSIPLTITGTAGVLDKRIDTVLVGFFIGPVAVAYYTVSRQIIQFITAPIEALGFTLSPTYEAQKAKDNSEVAGQIYEEALSHGLLLYIPAAAGLILVAEPLVTVVFGEGYLGAVPVLQVLAVFAVLQSVKILTDNGLDFLGRARDRAITKSVAAILNFCLNLILIPWIGVVGAALATVISDIMYTCVNIYIMHSEMNLHLYNIIHHLGRVLGITAIMSATVYLTTNISTGYMSLIIMISTGVITWFILVTTLGIIDLKRIYLVLS